MASLTVPTRFALAVTAVLLSASPTAAFTHYEDDGSCQIVGDTDIYGVGVRVGYYLTFFAGVLAVGFNNSKGTTDSLKAVNTIFSAILIVLIRNAALGSFAVLEWQIATVLVFLLPLASLLITFMLGGPGLASWGAFFILYGLYAALQPWLFWTLLEQGRDLACPSIRMFIYAPFDFYNPIYVKFIRAMSIISCVSAPLPIIGGCYLIGSSMKGRRTLRETSISRRIKEAKAEVAGSDIDLDMVKRSGLTRVVMVIAILFGGCAGIVSVERVISLNSIDLTEVGFLSTGQLIPFLVGLFTFISTAWSIITNSDDD
ncbi:hypothetical protein B0T25DRAFT_565963 [Lasiosphaeria hispida]|uniref:Uncharacterized protein n=1 Tax=Lasiosphaeria hispida TaxID=260671 RepID=A0AAJ0HKU5_9PEZI|nr:hypothetical protein B0T25DRAFT_565963 [Lasiosphaeria hispida]